MRIRLSMRGPKTAAVAVATMAMSILMAGQAAPAQAGPVQTYRNAYTGFCLDDSPEFGLRTFPCNGLNYQQWLVSSNSWGAELRNANTGRCLDDSVEFGLRTFGCNGTLYQRFRAPRLGDGSFQLLNYYKTKRCVNNPTGTFVYATRCDGYNPPQQLWR